MSQTSQPSGSSGAAAGSETGVAPVAIELEARRPIHRRLARRALRALRPLALPVLHRMDWRVRGAVDRSGTADAVQRLEQAVQGLAHGLTALAASQETSVRALAALEAEQALRHAAIQGQNFEIMARLEPLEHQRAELNAHLNAHPAPAQAAQIEELRADLLLRLDALSLSHLRAKVFSTEIAASEARLRADLDAALARSGQAADRLGDAIGAVARQADDTSRRTDEVAQGTAALVQRTDEVAQSTAALVQRTGTLMQRADSTLDLTTQLLRRNAIPLGRDVAMRTDDGYLLVPAEDEQLLVAMAETAGRLEPGTLSVLLALLPEGGLMVDVGAHVGTLCVPAVRRLGPGGHVLALEPTPRTAALLRRSLALNGLEGRVTVLECAAGADEGRAMLGLSPVLSHNSLAPLDEATDHVEVAVRPLDAVVEPGRRVDLVKIDAEGFELQVWRGMRRIVAENRDVAVVVEFGPSHIRRAGGGVADWIAELRAPGFTPWEIDEAGGVLRPLRERGIEDVFSLNLLLLRDVPDRRTGLRLA